MEALLLLYFLSFKIKPIAISAKISLELFIIEKHASVNVLIPAFVYSLLLGSTTQHAPVDANMQFNVKNGSFGTKKLADVSAQKFIAQKDKFKILRLVNANVNRF